MDAPTEYGVAWGKYSVSFGCSDDGFSRNFYLDFRDANWPDSPYITPDINITYYPDNASAYKLKAQCDGGSNWISSGETIRVWSLAGNSQNKTELLIPVSATNDWEDGNIKMGGTTFAVPESLNWGWSTTHAIEAITPQTDNDIIYTFTEWDNGSGTNPFNPGTKIQYTLAEECQVRIAIYNFAGQHIKTLLSSTRSAGNHDLLWNGKDRYGTPVSAGVYFYKISAISLQANSKTGPWNYTGKMILVK